MPRGTHKAYKEKAIEYGIPLSTFNKRWSKYIRGEITADVLLYINPTKQAQSKESKELNVIRQGNKKFRDEVYKVYKEVGLSEATAQRMLTKYRKGIITKKELMTPSSQPRIGDVTAKFSDEQLSQYRKLKKQAKANGVIRQTFMVRIHRFFKGEITEEEVVCPTSLVSNNKIMPKLRDRIYKELGRWPEELILIHMILGYRNHDILKLLKCNMNSLQNAKHKLGITREKIAYLANQLAKSRSK
jgi:DNA-binding Lrp family transcriptional regulator